MNELTVVTVMSTVTVVKHIPFKTRVDVPLNVGPGKPTNDWASCAQYCVSQVQIKLYNFLGQYQAKVPVSEMIKLQFTCEEMCTNGTHIGQYILEARF